MNSREILACHETPTHLYLLMRPVTRHGQIPADSSWWRKAWNGDDLVEVGDRPLEYREVMVKIPALDN